MTYGSQMLVSLNQNHFSSFLKPIADLNPDGLCWDLRSCKLSPAYTVQQSQSLILALLLLPRALEMWLHFGTNYLWVNAESIGRKYFYYSIVEKALELDSSSNSAISYDLEPVMSPLGPYPTYL